MYKYLSFSTLLQSIRFNHSLISKLVVGDRKILKFVEVLRLFLLQHITFNLLILDGKKLNVQCNLVKLWKVNI